MVMPPGVATGGMPRCDDHNVPRPYSAETGVGAACWVELSQAGSAITMLGLADECNRSTGVASLRTAGEVDVAVRLLSEPVPAAVWAELAGGP
jgi:hypothetical protein